MLLFPSFAIAAVIRVKPTGNEADSGASGDLVKKKLFDYVANGQIFSAAGQGRVIQRVGSPSRKVGRPPGSESLEADW